MKSLITSFANSQSGATAIEYALLAALIAVGIIFAAEQLGTEIGLTFDKVQEKLANTG
ncbi:MAG: Flp family type IVb pilin [Hyphomicrobiaceae bacterium]|nr:Flp family type IVb pilin [Hyphomicrobiaceae bacterium]